MTAGDASKLTFLHEAEDLLSRVEQTALDCEHPAAGAGALVALFHTFHTLKGAASAAGERETAAFAHHVESLLDAVRQGRVPMARPVIDIVLAATDVVHAMLAPITGGPAPDPGRRRDLVATIQGMVPAAATAGSSPGLVLFDEPAPTMPLTTWSIAFAPDPTLLQRGVDPAEVPSMPRHRLARARPASPPASISCSRPARGPTTSIANSARTDRPDLARNLPMRSASMDATPISTASTPTYITFRLGDEHFAIDVACVREVLELGAVTRLPQAPSYLRGIVNVRGTAIAVVDLRAKFGLPRTEDTPQTRVIVAELSDDGQPCVLGGLADSVNEVVEIPRDEVRLAPTTGMRWPSAMIFGLLRHHDRFVIVLDAHELFAGTAEAVAAATTREANVAPATPGA